MPARRIFLVCCLLVLTACQTSSEIKPNHVIQDAHGGGSVVAIADTVPMGASGGWGGYIRIWNLNDGEQSTAWKAHRGEVKSLYFLDRDSSLISAGYDGSIVEWELSGRPRLLAKADSPITDMALDRRHRVIVSGHKDGTVRRWSLDRLRPLSRYHELSDQVRAVALDPTSGLTASADADGNVYLWGKNESPIHLDKLSTDIRTLRFSPDGRHLFGGTWFHIYRWDTATRTAYRLPTGHRGIITDMQFSSDGRELLTISRQTDSAVLALDPDTGQTLRDFGRHQLCGSAVDVSADGKYLLTTSDDASVRIWLLNP